MNSLPVVPDRYHQTLAIATEAASASKGPANQQTSRMGFNLASAALFLWRIRAVFVRLASLPLIFSSPDAALAEASDSHTDAFAPAHHDLRVFKHVGIGSL